MGHGFRNIPQWLADIPEVGMLHFTAPPSYGKNIMVKGGTWKWCRRAGRCNHTADEPGGDLYKFQRSWGMAEYYGKITWDWAIFQGGTSRLRSENDGH